MTGSLKCLFIINADKIEWSVWLWKKKKNISNWAEIKPGHGYRRKYTNARSLGDKVEKLGRRQNICPDGVRHQN